MAKKKAAKKDAKKFLTLIAADPVTSADPVTTNQIGRYQLFCCNNRVYRLDTVTGAVKG